MKYVRFKLKISWYGIRVNFSLKKELKPKFLLSCFAKLALVYILPKVKAFHELIPVALIKFETSACGIIKPEDHWTYIAHLSAEAMLKSAVTEDKED